MTGGSLHRRSDLILAVVGVVVGVMGGLISARSDQAAIVFVGASVALALVLTRPVVLGVVALLGCFAVQRMAGLPMGSTGVSYSDVLLVAATALAVPSLAVGHELRRLRVAMTGLAVYLACLLPAVILDGSSRSWFEWGHRLFLVGGALIVGAWVVREGYARVALRSLVLVGSVFAVLAIAYSLRHGLDPATPFDLNKNFVGSQLSIVLIVALTAPREASGLHGATRLVPVLVLAAGLVSTQSRGGMLAAAAGVLFVLAFSPRTQARQVRGLVLLVAVVMAAFVFFSIRTDLSQSSADLENSSIGVRRQVEHRTIEIWRTSPVHGVGLKYFTTGEYGSLAQAPNIVLNNELAESGVIGLAGFVVLQGLSIAAGVRRRRDAMVIVGAGCVLAGLVHGMVDIYWGAATVPLTFLMLGLALGREPEGHALVAEPKISESAVVRT
jgi:polysaccharide biosynthesis protein PslJ